MKFTTSNFQRQFVTTTSYLIMLLFFMVMVASLNAQTPTLNFTIGEQTLTLPDEASYSEDKSYADFSDALPTASAQGQPNSENIFTIDGPFCNGCDDPKGGSSLACTGGANSIIQGIDVSSITGDFFVHSVDFNQETFGGAPSVTVSIFCGAAGTVHYTPKNTPIYSQVYQTKRSDDGKCVNIAFDTPPLVDSDCGTTIWVEFKTKNGKRCVSTPRKCNGVNATGNVSYIRTPSCSVNTPKKFKNTGFKLDASFALNVSTPFNIEGDLSYCASPNAEASLTAAGDWTDIKWSNGATTQTIEVTAGTYSATVINAEGDTYTHEVTVVAKEPATTAIAGIDQTKINNRQFTLAANTPTMGTGQWSTTSEAVTIDNPNSPTSTVTIAEGTTYVTLTWTITNGTCSSSDEVNLMTRVDEDEDGVPNDTDQCPSTPNGETVDANGCSQTQLDGDLDGIFNDKDICPDTPAGASVDDNGCADTQRDSDGDGVMDAFDICNGGNDRRDGDGDGTPDFCDECPFDQNKTTPGNCGCGIVEMNVDFDRDGVLDCLDGCPYDGNKIEPGNCGCGVPESPDTDGDGVYDCNDECPLNPNKTKEGTCGCDAPGILSVAMTNESVCNNQNTESQADDTYTADVVVTFDDAPKLGAILITGAVTYRHDFDFRNADQTVFTFNLPFAADGQRVNMSIEYIGNEGCNFKYQSPRNAPESCSVQICDAPADLNATVEGNKATLMWEGTGNAWSCQVEYRKMGDEEWHTQWTDVIGSYVLCDLTTNTNYEYRARTYCTNTNKSEWEYGEFSTAANEVVCVEKEGEDCAIQDILVRNIRDCNDRGTGIQRDDYFFADVVITFENAPTTGTLEINGNAALSIPAARLAGLTQYTFNNVRLAENNNQLNLMAYFSAQTTCAEVLEVNIPNNPCWHGRSGKNSYSSSELKIDTGVSHMGNATLKVENLKLYPNPVKEVLTVELPNIEKGELIIYDMLGKVVLRQVVEREVRQVALTIPHLRNGVYHLVIQHENRMERQQFVKQ